MVLAVLLLLATLADDFRAATDDQSRYAPAERPFVYYATTAAVDPAFGMQGAAGKSLQFVCASASPQPILEKAAPVQIGPTLYRLDLRDMLIAPETWRAIVANDPYARGQTNPLVSRADWLVVQLSDSFANPTAYYPIVFRGKIPKTRDEALTILGVDLSRRQDFGQIEGRSGVSVAGTRWIESRPLLRGYAYGTRDSAELTADRDPLEQPEGDFAHDAEEWLVFQEKFSARTGKSGVLMVGFLADGSGKLVNRADVRIVEDHTRFRGFPEVRAVGSCLSCHTFGPNYPTVNALREQIELGVDKYAQAPEWDAIERFHFRDLATLLERNREDYAAAIDAILGETPDEAVRLFRQTVDGYDQDVPVELAAFELGLTVPEFVQRLALANSGGGLPARVAGLAHGQTMPRKAFEEAYFALWLEMKRWKTPVDTD